MITSNWEAPPDWEAENYTVLLSTDDSQLKPLHDHGKDLIFYPWVIYTEQYKAMLYREIQWKLADVCTFQR